ncbi:MAG: glutamine-hydrolyzing GMP synthase, partial [Gammaproteobacteria bacterium]|nr:glutamine-hydrolyzing GMP synthase [Gammaproteobacteria bacterium]
MSLPAAGIATATDEAVSHRILILDFGAQYTQLIARRVREAGVYSEILPWDADESLISEFAPNGVVLAGGPESVVLDNPPRAPQLVFDLGVPLLGICYGMQTMAAQLGGEVESSSEREFGYAQLKVTDSSRLLDGLQDTDSGLNVWMSHGDRVNKLPAGFRVVASSGNAPLAAMADETRNYYGLQFHPEVTHTEHGQQIIERFVHDVCGCPNAWNPGNIIARDVEKIRAEVGEGRVLLGLSGGVDSSVVAALLHEALGDQLVCVFVDHGLLRRDEGDQVMEVFANNLGV